MEDHLSAVGCLFALVVLVAVITLGVVLAIDGAAWQRNVSKACSEAGGRWTTAVDDRGRDTRVCTRDGVVILTRRGFK